MDKIFIRQLSIPTYIGVYDVEQKSQQTIVFDIEMATDIQKASQTDDIQHALDYAAISRRLSEFVSQSRLQLVETLAEKVAAILQKEFNVSWLRLKLSKNPFDLDNVDSVGIIIERGTRS